MDVLMRVSSNPAHRDIGIDDNLILFGPCTPLR
jgi:hypothetical protein